MMPLGDAMQLVAQDPATVNTRMTRNCDLHCQVWHVGGRDSGEEAHKSVNRRIGSWSPRNADVAGLLWVTGVVVVVGE